MSLPSDSSDGSLSSQSTDSSSASQESSSDWDVTSSDGSDSSDGTAFDIYSNTNSLSIISPSNKSTNNEFDTYFDSNANTFEGELSNYDSQSHTNSHSPSKMPYLLKMTTSHYNEPQIQTEAVFDLQIDLAYYLYSLFYPYTNYQELLFSQCYIYEKIKRKKNFKIYEDIDEEETDTITNEITMDWNNVKHIERICHLLSRLLKTAGPKGIEEMALYQMFSSPSPLRIIYELRFGLYSNLCIAHLDRFGKRTFFYLGDDSDENYFFNDDLLTQDILNEIDVDGLSDFIRDEKRKSINESRTETIKNESQNAKIQPSPIQTVLTKTKSVNPKKKSKKVRENARKRAVTDNTSVSAHSSPRAQRTRNKNGVSSPITPGTRSRKKYTKRTITTITTITRSKSKGRHRSTSITRTKSKKRTVKKAKNVVDRREVTNDEREKLRIGNYAITTLFRRRLSAENEMLIKGLNSVQIRENIGRNIRFRRQQRTNLTKRDKNKKRRRKITIEDMGNGKWCTIQLNHQFLVSGYVRMIAKFIPSYLTVPIGIVKLVGMFYYFSSHLLLISGSMECRNTKHNQLHILGISNKKRYKIKLNRLKKKKANIISENKEITLPKSKPDIKSNPSKSKTKLRKDKNSSLSVLKRKKKRSSTPTPKKKSRGSAKLTPKKRAKTAKKKKTGRTMSMKFRKEPQQNNHAIARNEISERRNAKRDSAQNGHLKTSTKIKRGNADVSLTKSFDRYGLGNCFATSLSLPQWPWLKNRFVDCGLPIHKKGKYCVIIRSGGTYTWDETVSKENDIIIFNSKHLYHTHSHKDRKRMIVELNGHMTPRASESEPKPVKTKKKSKKKHKKHRHKHRNGAIQYLKYAKPKVINGYYARLPSFRKEIEYLSVIYNEYNSKLFSFGGLNLGRCIKSVTELQLNCDKYRHLKWRKAGSLRKGRYSCSLVNCDGYVSNNICVIGGFSNNSKEMRGCELYNLVNRESVNICAMNEGRANCGSCYITDLNKGTIVVGGGVKYGDGSKQIELYNFEQNKWTIHSCVTNYKHSFPTIWSDQINPNIIYIGGDNIGISGGGRNANLGFIEWCDLRDGSKKTFNVLYEDSIDRLWRFKGLSQHHHNAWESRSLFCM